MNHTVSDPPKHRRRRWPSVALLLLLTCGLTWWFWPRGDARFVGEWLDTRNEGGVYDFRRTGVVYWGNEKGTRTAWTHWTINNNLISFGCPLNSSPHPLRLAYGVWGQLTGQQWIDGGLPPFQIVEISPQRLTVREIDQETNRPSDPFALERLPE